MQNYKRVHNRYTTGLLNVHLGRKLAKSWLKKRRTLDLVQLLLKWSWFLRTQKRNKARHGEYNERGKEKNITRKRIYSRQTIALENYDWIVLTLQRTSSEI